MNVTIANMSGKYHTAQADLNNVQNAGVQISTDIPITKEEKEEETAAVDIEMGKE